MEREFKGIWIEAEIWENEELTIMEKVFFAEIDSFNKGDRTCYANNQYFADFFKLSKNRCSEIIKSLEKKNMITISYQYKKGTKQIEKRFLKTTKKYFIHSENNETPSEYRLTPSEYRLTPSENTEDINTINNTNNNIYIEEVVNKYNNISELSNIVKVTDKRKKALNARIKDSSIEDVFKALDIVASSDFLKGNNNRNWKCDFDWIMNPNNFIKILEGRYGTIKEVKREIPKQQQNAPESHCR